MRRPSTALRRLREDQRGLTMAEVLIASMLSMIILVMVTSMFVQTTKITTASNQTKQSNAVAANVMNELSAVLRVAATNPRSNSAIPESAIQAATRSSITFYAYSNTDAANPKPVKVTFALNASNEVWETRCAGVPSGEYYTFTSCASTSTRMLGKEVLAPTGTGNQLFTYLDANGAAIVIGTGAMSASDRDRVASITVQVRARDISSKNDPVFVSNTVYLRNLGLDSGS
ncbi:MAG TPA: hypothetical protein VNR36_13240 [Pseudolysinimonas sp.]|nr:hypothetical protein [Pseudolysinimonas sp.]